MFAWKSPRLMDVSVKNFRFFNVQFKIRFVNWKAYFQYWFHPISFAVCRNLYGRMCNLFEDYCEQEAYKYVKASVVEKYRYSCPVKCGRCREGETKLDVATFFLNSKYILSLCLENSDKHLSLGRPNSKEKSLVSRLQTVWRDPKYSLVPPFWDITFLYG